MPEHSKFCRLFCAALLVLFAGPAVADADHPTPRITQVGTRLDVHIGNQHIELALVRDNVLHVHYLPDGCTTQPTLVMAPQAPTDGNVPFKLTHEGSTYALASASLRAVFDASATRLSLYVPGQSRPLLYQRNLADLSNRAVVLDFANGSPLYGVDGYKNDSSDASGIVRGGMHVAKAGLQGQVGAPFVWSTAGFGVLVDTRGATYDLGDRELRARNLSQPDVSYYLIVGTPKKIFAALNDLSGHPQLFPKWALGFTNSQWGIDQQQLLDIVHTYRSKHIPIDNFTLDFDWKAWGEDNYGEFRWNPVKFPDGPSGKLAKMLAREGIHLTGIMKPRIHVDTVQGRYASAHHLWFPGENTYDDYFSHKPVRDIDFNDPAARAWFGDMTMKYAFAKGIVGWWNDEADQINANNEPINDDTQFLNMQRSLYNAQRRVSDVRVWSINRNFWLGSQRYAYGMWSGDIDTGFDNMAAQRERMLSAIDVGETLWGMDGGGFNGNPTPENYARWIQFGAFTPIFRVHGQHNMLRQPWRYGAVAEKAATDAIRLRYSLIPYIYSYFRQAHVSGVGLVRPLIFDWPQDPKVRNDIDAWMFGDWLMVSPVVSQGIKSKSIYLPAGEWIDWNTGKRHVGGRTIEHIVDNNHWSDIPIYVRTGAIIPMQPVMDYVGQKPVTQASVEIFPSTQRTRFDYYDDDGETYAYERGVYYRQVLSVQRAGNGAVKLEIAAPDGSFKPALRHYLLKIHGAAATSVTDSSTELRHVAGVHDLDKGQAWTTGQDRFGKVTYVRVDADTAHALKLGSAPQ